MRRSSCNLHWENESPDHLRQPEVVPGLAFNAPGLAIRADALFHKKFRVGRGAASMLEAIRTTNLCSGQKSRRTMPSEPCHRADAIAACAAETPRRVLTGRSLRSSRGPVHLLRLWGGLLRFGTHSCGT